MTTRKRKSITFKIDESVLEALADKGKDENNSANRLVENLLIETLRNQGYLKNFTPLGETRGRNTN